MKLLSTNTVLFSLEVAKTDAGPKYAGLEEAKQIIRNLEPELVIPCVIGDKMWCIRNQSGKLTAQQGTVSEMFFTKEMKLMIVVKYVGRGFYNDTIFATEISCKDRIAELNREEEMPWTDRFLRVRE